MARNSRLAALGPVVFMMGATLLGSDLAHAQSTADQQGSEADQLGEVFAGDQAEVFIPGERGNIAEASAGEEDGEGAQD